MQADSAKQQGILLVHKYQHIQTKLPLHISHQPSLCCCPVAIEVGTYPQYTTTQQLLCILRSYFACNRVLVIPKPSWKNLLSPWVCSIVIYQILYACDGTTRIEALSFEPTGPASATLPSMNPPVRRKRIFRCEKRIKVCIDKLCKVKDSSHTSSENETGFATPLPSHRD